MELGNASVMNSDGTVSGLIGTLLHVISIDVRILSLNTFMLFL